MFGSTILDVTIGLILTYLVMALVCSAVNEGIASLFSFRAKFLEEGVRNLVGNGLADQLFQHGLVQGLTRRKPEKRENPPKPGKDTKPSARHPSYLPSPVFAVTLLEAAAKLEHGKEAPKGVDTAAEVRKAVDAIPDEHVKEALNLLWKQAGGDVATFQKKLEGWYDDAMERVSGWYKRRTQLVLAIIAVVFVALANADTVSIASGLWTNSSVRAAASAQAATVVQTGQGGAQPDQRLKDLEGAGLPIGWDWNASRSDDPRGRPSDAVGWVLKVIGLLFTVGALTLGAPFWFDLLSKFVSLRSSGKVPGSDTDKKADEAKQPTGT
jgi:hypothetical protein